MTQHNDSDPSSIIEGLAQQDTQTRLARAQRLTEIFDALPDPSEHSFGQLAPIGLSSAGPQSHILMENAMGCYRDGHYAAALVCAHALCEHELSGRLRRTRGSQAPRGSEGWGLGRLLRHAASEGWFDPHSQALLEDVNCKRRAFYHYREIWDEDTVVTRAVAEGRLHSKDQADAEMRTTLRTDALQAIRAAFIVRYK